MLCTVGLEVYKGMISCYELNNNFLHAHLMQTLLPMYGGFVNIFSAHTSHHVDSYV